MRSVLNEDSNFFSAVYDAYKDMRKNEKDSHYLGGSISKYVNKKLVMTFPMICDNTLTVDTMQMISKANEKNIALMFQQFFAANSINGSDGAEVIKLIHMNMDSDIDDIIDAIGKYVGESANIEPVKEAEIRDAIREMVYQLKTPQKTFPVESLNETSLNDYVVRNMNGKTVVMERSNADRARYKKQKEDNDRFYRDSDGHYDDEENERHRRKDERDEESLKYAGNKDAREANADRRAEADERRKDNKDAREANADRRAEADERRKNSKETREAEKRAEERKKDEGINRREGKQDLKDRDMQNQFFNKQIMDADFKKANELQPTPLIVNFNTVEGNNVVDRKSFIAGIKSRMIGVDGLDIVERIVAKNKSELSFKNFIRATTGEINFVTDFLLAINQQKLNAKNAAKKGYAAQMWNLLEKRSLANKGNKAVRKSNDASAITSLVVNQETANYMLANYKFDLEDPKNAIKVMDEYNLMGIFIADEANEAIKYIADGNKYYETIAYTAMAREVKDAKAYKDTVNLINKAGR